MATESVKGNVKIILKSLQWDQDKRRTDLVQEAQGGKAREKETFGVENIVAGYREIQTGWRGILKTEK